jgi:hypothetical protein
LRFFPISKIEYQLNLHFLATGRFCRPSLMDELSEGKKVEILQSVLSILKEKE